MVRSKKPHTTGDTSPNPAIEKRRLSPTLFFLAVILIPTGMLVTIALIGTDSSGPDFRPLVGRWARTDANYALEISKVSADGTVEADYFNPGKINVSKARAERDGSTVKLFVELRDVNYPGSTYSLIYDAEQDELRGTYFQAVEKTEGEVSFRRVK